jgi:hypothetical protein
MMESAREETPQHLITTRRVDIALPRAQDWQAGMKIPGETDVGGPKIEPLMRVLENQNEGTEITPIFRVYLGSPDPDDTSAVMGVCKFQPGFAGAYYQVYLRYPCYRGQSPALRVACPSGTTEDLFLWAKLQGTRVRKLVGPNKEEPFLTWKREEGGKKCCSGSTRVRVSFLDVATKQTVMVRDQIQDQITLEPGQNILLAVLLAFAMDRAIKFTGSKFEKKHRKTSALRVGQAFGLVGAVASISIDAARGRKQHGLYQFEVLNKIK